MIEDSQFHFCQFRHNFEGDARYEIAWLPTLVEEICLGSELQKLQSWWFEFENWRSADIKDWKPYPLQYMGMLMNKKMFYFQSDLYRKSFFTTQTLKLADTMKMSTSVMMMLFCGNWVKWLRWLIIETCSGSSFFWEVYMNRGGKLMRSMGQNSSDEDDW